MSYEKDMRESEELYEENEKTMNNYFQSISVRRTKLIDDIYFNLSRPYHNVSDDNKKKCLISINKILNVDDYKC